MVKEIKALTSIRGMAALYVAIGHFFTLTRMETVFPGALNNLIKNFGLSVDLFFILSGFLLMLTSNKYFNENLKFKNYYRFMCKRFFRIYPLLFLCVTFVFVMINRFSSFENYFKGLALIFSMDGYRNSLFVLWSLRAEWITYLFFPLIIFTVNKLKIEWVYLLTTLFFVLFINFLLYKYVTGIESLLRCWFDYSLGILVFKLSQISKIVIQKNKNRYLDLLIIIIIILLLFFEQSQPFIIVLFAIVVLFMVQYPGVFSKALEHRFLYYLGLISYSIYLVHPLIIYYINKNQLDPGYLLFISYIAVLIIISSITYTFIEKPGMNLLKHLTKT